MQVGDGIWSLEGGNTQVFPTLLGLLTLTTWKFILKELPPLSPPIFSQISSLGSALLCQLRLFNLYSDILEVSVLWYCVVFVHLLFPSRSWKTLSFISGIKANAAPLISSPPDFSGNVKGAASPIMLVVTISVACFRSLRSLATLIFKL